MQSICLIHNDVENCFINLNWIDEAVYDRICRAGLSKREALGLTQTRGPKNLLKFHKKSKKNQISFFEKKNISISVLSQFPNAALHIFYISC